MSDKVTIMKKWIDDIRNDEFTGGISEQELAYVIYAAVMYGVEDEKINIGDLFGGEFKHLNWAMPNIWGQIDNMQGYSKNQGEINAKYDKDAIRELRLEGCTAKQVCERLGYPQERAKSITSNAGWIEAGKMLRERKSSKNRTENCTENGADFCTGSKNRTEKCTDFCTDSVSEEQKSVQKFVQKCTENTEKYRNEQKIEQNSVPKSVQESVQKFKF